MTEALAAVLHDALPRVETAYVLGLEPDDPAALAIGARVRHHDVVTNALDLSQERDLIVAGPAWEAAFDGRPETTFRERLAVLNSALTPGGTLVVTTANLTSTAQVMVGEPAGHDINDLDGGAYDATRPHSSTALVAALKELGHSAATVHEVYGADDAWCIVSDAVSSRLTPGDFVTDAVTRALEAQFADRANRVLPAHALTQRLAAAGALSTAASSFIGVVGARARSVYAVADDGRVQWLDKSPHDTRWAVGGAAQEGDDRPVTVPVGRTVENELLRAVAGADMGTFRDIAARFGRWVATSSQLDHCTTLDLGQIVTDGDSFAVCLDFSGAPSDAPPAGRELLLARAWRNFARRARFVEGQLPWPATFSDDELVGVWLSMSGVADARAAELIAETHDEGTQQAAGDDAYSLTLGAGEDHRRIVSLEEEIAALHDTLHARDEELAIRARVIRSLRQQVVSASTNRDLMAKANADIKNSAAFRLANQFRRAALITRPKQLIRSVGKSAEKRVKTLRRAG